MIASLKSELRKLLSVRSTYIILASAFAIIALFTFVGTSASTYEEAVCANTGEVLYSMDYTDERLQQAGPEEICGGQVNYNTVAINDLSKDRLLFNLQENIEVIKLFVTVIVILFMGHEFRYYTINHTLTLSNNRSKVLISKIAVSSLFTIIATLAALGLVVIVTQIAINIKDLNLPAQDYDWPYVFGRFVAYALMTSLLYLGVITLVRNLIAGIVATFLLPAIDALAMVLLSLRDIEPTKILPLSALERFGSVASDITSNQDVQELILRNSSEPVSAMMAGVVVAAWLVGLWVVAWILFLRRDAS